MSRKPTYDDTRDRDTRRSRASDHPRGAGRGLWIFIGILVVVALIVVFRSQINDFFLNVFKAIGWGIIFVIAAILMLVILTWRRNLSSLYYYWNRWIGIFVFVFAAWGILGLIQYTSADLTPNGLGGSFGAGLVANPSPGGSGIVIGILCLLAYIIIGFFFIMPRQSWNAFTGFFKWIWSVVTVKPSRKPPLQEKESTIQHYPPTTAPMENKTIYSEPKERTITTEKTKPLITGAAPRSHAAYARWLKTSGKSTGNPASWWKLTAGDCRRLIFWIHLRRCSSARRITCSAPNSSKIPFPATAWTPRWCRLTPALRLRSSALSLAGISSIERSGKETATAESVPKREEITKTRVKVERIASLTNDLALALAAPTIRIEAPVPGKSYIGVEVPNMTSDMVSLRGVVETSAFQKLVAKTKMALALGKGAGGESVAADLTKMPHLLVAGATGSGKTVCLNTIICCLAIE